ncbi:cardiolipin synthase [Ereboglobus sp. PH5-5]|uniref:cardiolipin synthase n=1 Tax=Ereboglobus sp. PH5-5 TaxID=2940529 RepID=UPI002406DD79|nr:cardiolipin synthase [Ereboglobus sp. PH5-5]MDF9833677.1 cardiolipin synthase [Ereboglobus sp. PH5-5]
MRERRLTRTVVLLGMVAGCCAVARAANAAPASEIASGSIIDGIVAWASAVWDYVRSHTGAVVSVAYILIQIAGVLTSIRAILTARTSQGAVAWVVALILMPVVSVPAYWVFGRSKFHGYVTLRRQRSAISAPTIQAALIRMRAKNMLVTPQFGEPFAIELLAHLPLTRGNDVELLIDGDDTFSSIFDGIDRAREYVLVQFYIIHDDDTGRELLSHLVAKVKEGVRCHVLFDEIGSSGLTRKYVRDMRAAGINVSAFNTRRGRWNRFQINFRNHRKIVVVDGREAWVGGLNVGDEYRSRDKRAGYWRDTHTRLAGPVVQCVQAVFLEDWHWATGEIPKFEWRPEVAPNGVSRVALCLPSAPSDELETATLFFLDAINTARTRIWIASPYFVPDEQFISALQLAALRGVDVRILIPDKADNFLVQLSAWSYIEELETVGIKTFRYTKGFMHHKVVVVDNAYSTIGTANFDNRSFRLNFELTMAFADRQFNEQVTKMLENDFACSRLATSAELNARGFWFRLAVRVAMLLAPVQ